MVGTGVETGPREKEFVEGIREFVITSNPHHHTDYYLMFPDGHRYILCYSVDMHIRIKRRQYLNFSFTELGPYNIKNYCQL